MSLKQAAENAVAAWLATVAPEERAKALAEACERFRWQMLHGTPAEQSRESLWVMP